MEKSNHNQNTQQINLQLELKNTANLPENIKFFTTNGGTLCVAVDQAGKAIALTYVQKQ
jgi:hypothetical protein